MAEPKISKLRNFELSSSLRMLCTCPESLIIGSCNGQWRNNEVGWPSYRSKPHHSLKYPLYLNHSKSDRFGLSTVHFPLKIPTPMSDVEQEPSSHPFGSNRAPPSPFEPPGGAKSQAGDLIESQHISTQPLQAPGVCSGTQWFWNVDVLFVCFFCVSKWCRHNFKCWAVSSSCLFQQKEQNAYSIIVF